MEDGWNQTRGLPGEVKPVRIFDLRPSVLFLIMTDEDMKCIEIDLINLVFYLNC